MSIGKAFSLRKCNMYHQNDCEICHEISVKAIKSVTLIFLNTFFKNDKKILLTDIIMS